VTDRAPPDDLAAAIKAAGGQVMTVD
jgi:hypothetical protein